jgi:hypothetical protein
MVLVGVVRQGGKKGQKSPLGLDLPVVVAVAMEKVVGRLSRQQQLQEKEEEKERAVLALQGTRLKGRSRWVKGVETGGGHCSVILTHVRVRWMTVVERGRLGTKFC